MEYSKDIIFNIKYNEANNILKENNKKGWTSIVKEKIKKHKIITAITLICVILIAVDFLLIFNFTQLLQRNIIM